MWKPPTLVSAGSGAGKSFYFGAVLPSEMLAESAVCRIVTNIPINIEAMAEFVAQQSRQAPEAVASRIFLMPREIEEAWTQDIAQGGCGPWETFEQSGFDNTHFILDLCGVVDYAEPQGVMWVFWRLIAAQSAE